MLTDIREFLDRLLDENDWEILELVNDRGESAYFEQICLIPENSSTMYAIMQPVTRDGQELGEEIVFSFNGADTADVAIDVVTDQYVIRDVYNEYKKIREEGETLSDEEYCEDEEYIDGED